MTDRMDIDALLIGALYGELTPADEARLAAHLESHPADRTALADLTRTRAAVRESRILAVQLDPPQSVSALLLQEAARRAPRLQRETSSWFHRFARSFMAHPALAAATTCVVVGVVAGALYVRHGARLAEDSAVSRAGVVAGEAVAPAASSPEPPTAEPALAAAPAPVAPAAPAVASMPTGTASGRGVSAEKAAAAGADADAYRVKLDDVAEEQYDRRTAGRARKESDAPSTLAEGKKPAPVDTRFAAEPNAAVVADADLQEARPQKKAKGGIELRTPEPQPKELEPRSGESDRRQRVALENKPMQRPDGAGTRASSGGAAADDLAQAPAAPPPREPDPSANDAPRGPSKPAAVAKAPGKADAPKSESAAQRVVAGAQAPPATTGKANAQRNEGRLADQAAAPADGANDPVLGWAEKQRDQVIALVKSNNCRAAATAAVEIYNRVPDYYTANVATDRSVKPCLPYLNIERQREDKARAAKRANTVDAAPQQAAPQKDKK
jgi:hypothetical protein